MVEKRVVKGKFTSTKGKLFEQVLALPPADVLG